VQNKHKISHDDDYDHVLGDFPERVIRSILYSDPWAWAIISSIENALLLPL